MKGGETEMSLYHNYKLKEKTIQVKIPIEVDKDLRDFIFDNINTYRDIKNDFIEAANKHKDKYGTDYVRINVSPDTGIKIDIYEQVMNNWDLFLDYVWNSKRHRTDKKAGRGYVKATGKCPMCEDCPNDCPMEGA